MKSGLHKEPAREAMLALSALEVTPRSVLRNFAELAAQWHGFTEVWLAIDSPSQLRGLALSARSTWPDGDLEVLASLLPPLVEAAVDFETWEGGQPLRNRLPAGVRFCSVTPIVGRDRTQYGAVYGLNGGPRRLREDEKNSLRNLAGLAAQYLDRVCRDGTSVALRQPQEGGPQRWYSSLFASTTDFVFIQDLTGGLSAVNRVGELMTGYSHDELLRLRLEDLVSADEREKVRQIALEQFGGGSSQTYHLKFLDRNGTAIPVEMNVHLVFREGRPLGLMGFARDASGRIDEWSASRTIERRLSARNRELAEISHCWDHLYRLNTRSGGTFQELADDCLISGCEVLDTVRGFVVERTALGPRIHAAHTENGPAGESDRAALADLLALVPANVLSKPGVPGKVQVRPESVWASISVAEWDWGLVCFALSRTGVAPHPRTREFVAFLASRLGARLSEERLSAIQATQESRPAATNDPLEETAGVEAVGETQKSAAETEAVARSGRRVAQRVSRSRNRPAPRSAAEQALKCALEKREFFLRFQPQVHISGRLQGFEALLGWNHPELGQLSAGSFIPLAEESGLIVSIGAWVIEESCRVAARWREFTDKPVKTAMNVSTRQFEQPDFAKSVARQLEAHRLDGSLIELEVTESSIMRDSRQSLESMRELRAVGVRLAIDDFGTGYSSLSYLTRLPVHTLKIDRSFLADTEGGERALSTIRAIVTLAHNLDLEVVGEGVESLTQWKLLEEAGCDSIQGHFVGLPAGFETAVQLLKRPESLVSLHSGW